MHYKTVFSTLMLASFVAAQTPTITIPGKGGVAYDKAMAGYYGNYLGAYANEHIQYLNGDMEGVKSIPLFLKISVRRDMSVGFPNWGRSWTNVKINLAPHDYTTKTTTFSTNFFKTPTQVFSAAMSWPDTTNLPLITTNPSNWGHFVKKGDMTFTFSTPWNRNQHTKLDKGIVVDFLFTGGTLANNGSWGGFNGYYTDGIYVDTATTNFATVALLGKNACSVSGKTGRNYLVGFPRTNSAAATTNKSMFELYFSGIGMPNTTPVFMVLGVGGDVWYNPTTRTWPSTGFTGPIPFNTSCNPLYVDLKLPYFLLPNTTSGTGTISTAATPLMAPFNATFVGHRLWVQAAYTDPGTKLAELSMAGRCTLANIPHVTQANRMYNHSANVNSATAVGSFGTRVNSIKLHQ